MNRPMNSSRAGSTGSNLPRAPALCVTPRSSGDLATVPLPKVAQVEQQPRAGSQATDLGNFIAARR
ncbi:hypothetical protein GCM10009753_03370 [Streptantibioticus ferralitis]